MNIHGVGTDIVNVARIARLWDKYAMKFARHILAPHELENLPLSPYAGPTLSLKREKDSKVIVKLLAKRFAAKEAIVKALGTGFQEGIWLTNLEISHNALGKPIVVYHDAALDFITKLGVCGTEISISDEKDFAVAFVIVLKRV